ncbi:hypothetical protein Pcinc_031145 [Petrolisthes cinctipes]|uniref:Apolipoprotein B n=1 Tax=Petrolisthes cinctipes TaxID=88211 RepID=A0AAE1EX96_PETCI|nr:hypothetical protein Pcinc_031145 [Petrolisthes cinctipes]
MKFVTLLVLSLLQVGSVLAGPVVSTTSPSQKPELSLLDDFGGACFSSGKYTKLQQEVAAPLWRFDKSNINSRHLQEHHGSHAFRIAVTYNTTEGELQFSLSTDVLNDVVPGICITSEIGHNIHVDELEDHVFPWVKIVKQTSQKSLSVSFLKMLQYGELPSLLDGIVALIQAYDGGRTNIIAKLVNLTEFVSDIMASTDPQFVIHVIPPFPEIVVHQGPILESLMEGMKNLQVSPEEKTAMEVSELVNHVLMPQLLIEVIPVLPGIVMSVPPSIVEQGLLMFQDTFEIAVLPSIVSVTFNTSVVTKVREVATYSTYAVTRIFKMIPQAFMKVFNEEFKWSLF